MVQGQEKESANAKLIPLRVELARLLDWVVLLLPETIWAEEDNKSKLFEQRTRRRAVLFAAPRWVLFSDGLSGHASLRLRILCEIRFDEKFVSA